MSMITIRGNHNMTREPVVFESQVVDADGCKFFVTSTDSFKASRYVQDNSSGILIAFGPDELKDEDSGVYSEYFAFSAEDDKKIIAAQLRELADWLEQQ